MKTMHQTTLNPSEMFTALEALTTSLTAVPADDCSKTLNSDSRVSVPPGISSMLGMQMPIIDLVSIKNSPLSGQEATASVVLQLGASSA